jgi:hypothetical protein
LAGTKARVYSAIDGESGRHAPDRRGISMGREGAMNSGLRAVIGVLAMVLVSAVGSQGLGRPEAPSDVRAYLAPGERVRITWRDNSKNEDGFEVERRTHYMDEPGRFQTVYKAAKDAKEYTHPSRIREGEVTYFRVRALNSVGPSSYSNVAVYRR